MLAMLYPQVGILIVLSACGDNHYKAHQQMGFVMESRCESGSLADELNFEPVTQLSLPSA